ncbi:hypothetical protein M3I54_38325 [Paraburkholderia sp. CNPSo 3274]|uniref:hypothetical protein n=1 Tax=Paraburkholderia sp. CNPSo 3274 TaxID=2940932 RepID=UPI0020B7DD52|nr:hypothetical protein [Paraburkholderia sp. CNPSo 3274]MCP3712699.1 hypothetical protein [Paraburkholderia sp. CNPSo 3274]
MPEEDIGTVAYVKLLNYASLGTACEFGLVPSSGPIEHIILWMDSPGVSPLPAEADWVLRNAQVALLRDAFVNKLQVEIFRAADGTVVSVSLGVYD